MESEEAVRYLISGDIDSSGGYKNLVIKKKTCQTREIFIFPKTLSSLKSEERKQFTNKFIQKIYNVSHDKVDMILRNLVQPTSSENTSSENSSKSTNEPSRKRPSEDPDSVEFQLRKKLCLRPSHPGPTLPFLEKGACHSEDITLAAQYYLNLSNDKFEWTEQYGGDRFANRSRRRKRFNQLLGNKGKGWLKTKRVKFAKKRTKGDKTDAEEEELNVISTRVEGEDIKLWMENHVTNLMETGQFKDLSSLENCPSHLKKKVLWSVGIDAGDGSCKLAGHTLNIEKSNSGSTSPILNLVNSSDKKFANWQWNQLFQPTLKDIRNVSELEVTDVSNRVLDSDDKPETSHDHGYGSKPIPKKVIECDVIWCTDLEATANLLGHQGYSSKYPCHKCEIDRLLLQKKHSCQPSSQLQYDKSNSPYCRVIQKQFRK